MPVPPPGPPPNAPSSRKSTAQGKRAGGSSCSVRSSAASQTPSMADPADYGRAYRLRRIKKSARKANTCMSIA